MVNAAAPLTVAELDEVAIEEELFTEEDEATELEDSVALEEAGVTVPEEPGSGRVAPALS